jgi:hypothetical protein
MTEGLSVASQRRGEDSFMAQEGVAHDRTLPTLYLSQLPQPLSRPGS